MAGLLSDKNLRDTSTVTPRDSLAADARFSRGWNELITPHTTLGLPSSLSSPPVRRAAWERVICRAMCAVKSEKMISVGLIVVRTEWSVVWDERVVVFCFLRNNVQQCKHKPYGLLIGGDILWTNFILHCAVRPKVNLEAVQNVDVLLSCFPKWHLHFGCCSFDLAINKGKLWGGKKNPEHFVS